MRFTSFPAAVVAVTLSASPLMAQVPSPASQPEPQREAPATPAPARVQDQAQQALSVEGELLRVDAEAKHFWVRTAEGEKQFSFNDETDITGEGRNVEGLATMTGTRVKVEYKAEGTTAVATKIEIQARADQPAPSSPQPQQYSRTAADTPQQPQSSPAGRIPSHPMPPESRMATR